MQAEKMALSSKAAQDAFEWTLHNAGWGRGSASNEPRKGGVLGVGGTGMIPQGFFHLFDLSF